MLEILEDHLRGAASPEIYAMIQEAFELFESYGVDDYALGFDEIVLTADNEGVSESIIKVCNLVASIQDTVLAQLQIDLADEASVSEGNLILRGMKLLEKTEHMEDIAQICEEKRAPEEQLAEVLSMVTGHEEERILPLLETVGEGLILKISEMAISLSHEQVTILNAEADRLYVKNLMEFSSAVDYQWLYILDRIKAGEQLGKRYMDYHKGVLDTMQAKRLETPMPDNLYAIKLAVQLFATALVSVDGSQNVRTVVMEQLEKTFADLSMITPIYNELDLLSIKFQTYQTQLKPVMRTLPKGPSILNLKPL